MKKMMKIFIIIVLLLTVIGSGVLLYAGNYLYNLALNPATDKSAIFDNEATKNENEVSKTKYSIVESESTDVYAMSDDGLKLHSYSIHQDSNTWVIVVHGYTSQGNEMSWAAQSFYDQGYNVLVPDLRGHGKSDGDYIGMGWDDRKDIITWINELVSQDPDCEIILFGISMGAATVMNVSGEVLPDNVKLAIEDCGYTSTWDIFAYQLKSMFGLPPHPFLDFANIVTKVRAGYTFNNGPIDQIENCKIPMLFIHGSEDLFVPSYMIDELYKKATCPKDRLIIEGAGHAQSNDMDSTRYWNKVFHFIDQYL